MTAAAPIAAPGRLAALGIAPAGAGDTTFLDGLRGLAALYVVIHHAGSLLYQRALLPGETSRPSAALGIMCGAVLAPFRRGDVAVQFFFVLSGFVIHLRAARQRLTRPDAPFGWGTFIYRRIRRLYPLLLLALALTAVLDALGRRHGYVVYAHASPYPFLNHVVGDDYSFGTILGNLGFCMTLLVPALGSDGPLWSLAFEWWFYMLYPLLWALSRRKVGLATAGVVGAYALACAPQMWPGPVLAGLRAVLLRLPGWWTGALLAEAYARGTRATFARLAPLVCLIPAGVLLENYQTGVAALLRPLMPQDQAADVLYALAMNVVSVGFAGLLAGCFWLQAARPSPARALAGLRRLRWLGGMSYTLYVIHLPILVFISGWCMSRSADHHLPHDPTILAATLALVLAAAWAAHLLVEQPFARVGRTR